MDSAAVHLDAAKLNVFSLAKGHDVVKLGDLLNFSAGLAAGAIVLAAGARAAPVPPLAGRTAIVPAAIEQAVVSQDKVDQLKPVEVRWHHHYWHRHHWHHRHWHHRHW